MYGEMIELKDKILFADPQYLYWELLIFLGAVSVFAFIIRKLNQPELSYGSRRPFIGKIKFFGFFAVIAFLFSMLALARPYVQGGVPLIRKGSAEITFVVDNSGSMLAQDLGIFEGRRPARIDIAGREIIKLYSSQVIKEGDRVGVFVFGLSSHLRVYPTRDLQRSLNEISKFGLPDHISSDASYWGSNLALVLEDIYIRLDRFDGRKDRDKSWTPKSRSNRLVILISDGDFDFLQPAKSPEEAGERQEYQKRLEAALREFRRRQLKIYGVGIGSHSETRLDSILKDYKKGRDYNEKLPEEIKDLKTRFRSEGLDLIARQTGGKTPILTIHNASYSITDDLAKIIDSHRSTVIEAPKGKEKQELWRYALYFAFASVIAGMIFY